MHDEGEGHIDGSGGCRDDDHLRYLRRDDLAARGTLTDRIGEGVIGE